MSTTTTNLGLFKPELTDAADITAMNENWDKIDTELHNAYSDKNKPTPSDIGAVPLGYGYGEQMISVGTSSTETYEEYCAKIEELLDEMPNRTIKLINAAPPHSEAPDFGACGVMLYKGSNDYASLMTVGHSNIYAEGWRMQKKSGIWQPFEWVNPPMIAGVEYRTTERWHGYPVYTKNINCGSLPTVGSVKEVSLGITENITVLEYSGTIPYNGQYGGDALPLVNYSGNSTDSINTQINLSCTTYNVKIATIKWGGSVHVSNFSATVQIKYVKH